MTSASSWVKVNFVNSYTDPVVVCTPIYGEALRVVLPRPRHYPA